MPRSWHGTWGRGMRGDADDRIGVEVFEHGCVSAGVGGPRLARLGRLAVEAIREWTAWCVECEYPRFLRSACGTLKVKKVIWRWQYGVFTFAIW